MEMVGLAAMEECQAPAVEAEAAVGSHLAQAATVGLAA